MTVIRWAAFAGGLGLVVWTGASVMRSLIIPRGLASSLTAVVARITQRSFLWLANRFETYESKDKVLALEAPSYLVALLFTWLSLFLVGYALMLWPLIDADLADAFLEGGSSMLTLGFAATHEPGATVVHFAAGATGLVVIALQIGYLPTLYGAFNRRETLVTMLQSRAGSPAWGPEILARHYMVNLLDRLDDLYTDWERWAADVAESHTNYPVLIYFRSPHPLRSWVLGLAAVMDSAALDLSLRPRSAPTQSRLCLRMGFVCLRNIADFLNIAFDPDPMPDDDIELTYEEFHGGVHRLEEVGYPMERSIEEAWPHFRGWRVNYESLVYALADLVVAPPGPWSGPRNHLPGMQIIPTRPVDRRPGDTKEEQSKGSRVGY